MPHWSAHEVASAFEQLSSTPVPSPESLEQLPGHRAVLPPRILELSLQLGSSTCPNSSLWYSLPQEQ